MKAMIFTVIILFVSLKVHANDNFVDKSLICSTKIFPVKGGFYFQSNYELTRYNILWNHDSREEFLKTTKHCYMTINREIVISERSSKDNCGDYNTFINLTSLVYSIPTDQKILTADCEFYEGDLYKALMNSLNINVH